MRTAPHHSTGGIYGLLCRSDVNLSQRDAVALHIFSADYLPIPFFQTTVLMTHHPALGIRYWPGAALSFCCSVACMHACVPGKTTSFYLPRCCQIYQYSCMHLPSRTVMHIIMSTTEMWSPSVFCWSRSDTPGKAWQARRRLYAGAACRPPPYIHACVQSDTYARIPNGWITKTLTMNHNPCRNRL